MNKQIKPSGRGASMVLALGLLVGLLAFSQTAQAQISSYLNIPEDVIVINSNMGYKDAGLRLVTNSGSSSNRSDWLLYMDRGTRDLRFNYMSSTNINYNDLGDNRFKFTQEGNFFLNSTANTDAYARFRVNGGPTLNVGINTSDEAYVFNYADNNLKFGTNGIERMRINNVGLVGLGLTIPTAGLDISPTPASQLLRLRGGNNGNNDGGKTQLLFSLNNTTNHSHAISTRHHDSGNPERNGIDFLLWNDAQSFGDIGNTHAMSVTGAGVGIGGIYQPTAMLDVNGTGNFNSNLTVGGTLNVTGLASMNGGLSITGNSTTDGIFVSKGLINSTNYPWINYSNTKGISMASGDDNAFFGMVNRGGAAGGTNSFNLVTYFGDNHDDDYLIQSHHAGEIMRVTGDGNVGIGDIDPLRTLDVNGYIRATNGTNYVELNGGSQNASISFAGGNFLDFRYDGTAGMRMSPTGELAVGGGFNPTATLDVAGTGKFSGAITAGSTLAVSGTSTFADEVTIGSTGNTLTDLRVYGAAKVKELQISPTESWADYVFAEDYTLRSLSEVKGFIDANGHLPEVMSAEEVAETGYVQTEVNETLLRKIEELTLYSIALEETNTTQKDRLDTQDARLAELEASNAELRALVSALLEQNQK